MTYHSRSCEESQQERSVTPEGTHVWILFMLGNDKWEGNRTRLRGDCPTKETWEGAKKTWGAE